eukprot:9304637-Pyramimonas_sp.AAC.1
MICRRAPELAAGKFTEFINLLLRVSLNGLLFELAAMSLDGEDRAQVLRDYDATRRYVYFVCTLKFGCWQQLPWVLMGIASSSVGVGRECARKSLRLWTHRRRDHGYRAHFLETVLCDPASR